MKAIVYHKPKDMRYQDWEDPAIKEPRDAILRVTSTAICGSDLHFYNGTIPQTRPMVVGHEFMGIVKEVGQDVKNLKPGDRVVVPFPISCGECWFCRRDMPTHCERSNPKYGPEGGVMDEKDAALFGYSDLYGGYDGGQAELVRVPYADYGARKIPEGEPDEKYLFLTDIIPTGWTGIDRAQVKGGETVAVFGCGPVGLMAMKCAWLRGAERVIGVDVYDYRLDMARKACSAEAINSRKTDAIQAIRDATEGRGADVCVDAVGMEADIGAVRKIEAAAHAEAGTIQAFAETVSAVRRGGHIAVLGVYATSYDNFPFGQIFDKGLTIHLGQAPVQRYIDELMELIKDGKLVAHDIITHTLPLSEGPHGYQIFNDKKDNCVKVVLKP